MNGRRSRWPRILAPGLALLLSSVAAGAALEVWRWRPGTPVELGTDAPFAVLQVRTILDEGTYWSNPVLGWPFAQESRLFPDVGGTNLLLVRLLGLFTHDAFTVSAVFFMLGFPLAAGSMYWLARQLGYAAEAAVPAAVIFALAPGHQVGFGALWLSAYWTIPLGLWLILETAEGRTLWGPSRARRITTGVVVALVGLSTPYFVVFVALLLGLVAVMRRLVTRDARTWASPGLAFVGLMAALAVPIAAARLGAPPPTGPSPTDRSLGQTELLQGKLMDLVLPWAGHRVGALARVRELYDSGPRPTFERPALGIVVTAALAVTLLACCLSLLSDERRASLRVRVLGLLTVTAVAFYSVGGLSSAVSLFLTTQIRTWSRLWVVVLALGCVALAHFLDRLADARGVRTAVLAGALVAVVGIVDQTNPALAPDYPSNRAQLAGLRSYDRGAEVRVGSCPVFQLPVRVFPEAPIRGRMGAYDQLLPYLASPRSQLLAGARWSFGAVSGSAAGDWQLGLPVDDPRSLATALSAVGYCAVEVDTGGYEGVVTDGRNLPPAPDLEQVLGPPVLESPDGRLHLFRLPPAGPGSEELRAAVLAPVLATTLERRVPEAGRGDVPLLAEGRAVLLVRNLQARSRLVRVSLTVSTQTPGRVSVYDEGGRTYVARAAERGSPRVSFELIAPPGVTPLAVAVSGDGDGCTGEDCSFAISRLEVRTATP